MSYLLDQAKAEMERAKRKVQDLRRQYNAAADEFNKAKAKYDRLAARQFDIQLQLAHEREKAIAEGNHVLAALLTSPPR